MAIVFALSEEWIIFAGYCIFLAAIFDFLDGLSARLLGAYSETGKQLDSLADMVSFGVAPAAMLYKAACSAIEPYITMGLDTLGWEVLTFFPFLIAVFSALRLAKFNVDPRQREVFHGLPTPANALLITSFLMYARTHSALDPYLTAGNIVITSLLLSLLLVTDVPMLALKFDGVAWKPNKFRYGFLTICLFIFTFLVFLQEEFTLAIVLIIISYILYSVVLNLIEPVKK
jgi:CDP-diacylglycerol--serine O-phosphatidyltransferase